ncbi:MAG: hypothetical protein PHW04_12170 [Candidatus Wallbacteria bacterium]|nr:hypothetical protein [Candidatus Wallbacteria bacterium]
MYRTNRMMAVLLGVILMAGSAYAATLTSVVGVNVWEKVNPLHKTHYTYLQGTFDNLDAALENAKKNTDIAVELALNEAEMILKIDKTAMDYKVDYSTSFQPTGAREKVNSLGTINSIVKVTVWLKSNPDKTTNYVYLQGLYPSEEKALEAAKANTDAAVEAAVTEAMILLNANDTDLQYSVSYATSLKSMKSTTSKDRADWKVQYRPILVVECWSSEAGSLANAMAYPGKYYLKKEIDIRNENNRDYAWYNTESEATAQAQANIKAHSAQIEANMQANVPKILGMDEWQLSEGMISLNVEISYKVKAENHLVF